MTNKQLTAILGGDIPTARLDGVRQTLILNASHHWINSNNQLPDEGQDVLVVERGPIVSIATYFNAAEGFEDVDGYRIPHQKGIWWMPCPEPPDSAPE